MTYATLGRAQRMIGSFMEDFIYGFQDSLYGGYSSHGTEYVEHEYAYDRISNKVAETTADDFNDYQTITHRRNGEHFSQNPPFIQKVDPKVAKVVELLKNLKPKSNQNDSFVIRYARALDTLGIDQKSSPAIILMEIAKYLQTYYNSEKSLRSANNTNGYSEGRSFPANAPYVNSNMRRIHSGGPPQGLPGFKDLPPADRKINCTVKFYNI